MVYILPNAVVVYRFIFICLAQFYLSSSMSSNQSLFSMKKIEMCFPVQQNENHVCIAIISYVATNTAQK